MNKLSQRRGGGNGAFKIRARNTFICTVLLATGPARISGKRVGIPDLIRFMLSVVFLIRCKKAAVRSAFVRCMARIVPRGLLALELAM